MFKALLDCFMGKKKSPEKNKKVTNPKSKKLPSMASISPYLDIYEYHESTLDQVDEDIENAVVLVEEAGHIREYVVLGHLHHYDSYYAIAINKDECPVEGESLKVSQVEDFAVFQIIDGIGEVDFFYYLVKNSAVSKELFDTFFEYNQNNDQE